MKYLATVLFLVSFAAQANAQITITESSFVSGVQQSINTTTYTAKDLAVFTPILAAAGANQTWDFTASSYNAPTTSAYTISIQAYPDGAFDANFPDFTSATNVLELTAPTGADTIFSFLKITPTAVWGLGSSIHASGGYQNLTGDNPGQETNVFPMTYQTSWQSTFTEIDSFPGSGTAATFTTYQDSYVVDGWGTLITPAGSFQTLREKEDDTVTHYSGSGTVTGGYTYTWYTADGFSPASIDADQTGTVIAARYYVNSSNSVRPDGAQSSDGLKLTISQNPATSAGTQVLYSLPNSSDVRVELMDELGRSVRMLQNGRAPAGQNIITIDPLTLAQGTYFVRVEANGMTAMQKLVITR
ncbi:MAG TPA: T9SS type A sorting domain-containing protein [Candidatus Kapabacteria bacterium]|nr:T9SS type A sorting domain-containing protein [Candidatus Kapabacteria bacterium]